MLKIVICDDNCAYTEIVSKKIEKAMGVLKTEFSITTVASLDELKILLDKDDFQILFLDIMFGFENSAEWAIKNIPPENGTQIIFMTSFPSETHLISEVEHSYFLIKTKMSDELLLSALKKSIANLVKKEPNLISIKSGSGNVTLNCNEITLIESINNNCYINTSRGEKISVYKTLKEIMKELPRTFLHCHRSYAVNINYIRQCRKSEFVLTNGEIIPIPTKKYKSVLKQYESLINAYRSTK